MRLYCTCTEVCRLLVYRYSNTCTGTYITYVLYVRTVHVHVHGTAAVREHQPRVPRLPCTQILCFFETGVIGGDSALWIYLIARWIYLINQAPGFIRRKQKHTET